jgi:hypothetical protein
LGDGERDGGERFRTLDGCGEYDTPGGGVGTRTADCKTTGSDILILQYHSQFQMMSEGILKEYDRAVDTGLVAGGLDKLL